MILVGTMCAFEPSGNLWSPPENYRAIWHEAEMCTGKTGNFDRVTWRLVPGHDFRCRNGRCIGEWSEPHDISIAEEWKGTDWVIRHEIVHELTRFYHDGDGRGGLGPRDIQIWGVQCHATWGYLDDDPTYRP